MRRLLLISGIHANEGAASLLAAQVAAAMRGSGRACGHERIPAGKTLRGLLDEPSQRSGSWALTPAGIDLDCYERMVRRLLWEPDLVVIEVHNSPWWWARFGLTHGRCRHWRIGDLGPGTSGCHPLGFWWNRDPRLQGQRHALLEAPAVLQPEEPATVRHRLRNLRRLAAAGVAGTRIPVSYLSTATHSPATIRHGLMSPSAIRAVAGWISDIC